jgi:two-component system alkaline phosphatase synthesis response regulator PhoP
MKRNILVVDDDQKLVELIKLYLEKDGYRVLTAYDGQEALEVARSKRPDLIILDLMLPQVDGLDVCRTLREEEELEIPIIMLTAKTMEQDRIYGLDLGADDYVTKPFSFGELLARVRAVLRRAEGEEGPEELSFGTLTIDFRSHEVSIGGEAAQLTPTEFKLLETLVRQPGRAFTRLQLIHAALGYDFEGFERTIDTHIKNLRKKVESDPRNPRYIRTIFGVGYKFAPEES